jgi:hypothetical protein
MSRAIELQCVHAQNCSAGMAALVFEAVMEPSSDTGTCEKGDVVVIEGRADPDGDGSGKGNPSGHMAIWNGEIRRSDFKQNKAVYPGPGHRANKPPYKIYRFKVNEPPRRFNLGEVECSWHSPPYPSTPSTALCMRAFTSSVGAGVNACPVMRS